VRLESARARTFTTQAGGGTTTCLRRAAQVSDHVISGINSPSLDPGSRIPDPGSRPTEIQDPGT
jgi:hypothetical protein